MGAQIAILDQYIKFVCTALQSIHLILLDMIATMGNSKGCNVGGFLNARTIAHPSSCRFWELHVELSVTSRLSFSPSLQPISEENKARAKRSRCGEG
jgi:hypothetical protein